MVAMVTDGHNNKCVYGKRFLVYSTVNCCFARAKWYGNTNTLVNASEGYIFFKAV